MGIAMLMVVFHHLPIEIGNSVYSYLKLNAGFGVDIFLLLSGLGLYFSMSKAGSTLASYYKNRAIRIFPIYAIIILCVSLIKGDFDLKTYLLDASTLGWWIDGTCYDWFIPTIVLLYAVFPLFYYAILRHKTGTWGGVYNCNNIVHLHHSVCTIRQQLPNVVALPYILSRRCDWQNDKRA